MPKTLPKNELLNEYFSRALLLSLNFKNIRTAVFKQDTYNVPVSGHKHYVIKRKLN